MLILCDYLLLFNEQQAVWIRVAQWIKTSVETKGYSFRGGLHAACHALLNVVPL